MNKKMTLVVTLLVLSMTTWATPGSGFLFNTILNRAQTAPALHSEAMSETADGAKWHLQLKTEGGPSDFVVQDVALAPGGFSGWHSHPGPVLITIKEGTASWYDSDCVLHTYTAGMAFIEDGAAVHNVRNESATENLRLVNTYIIPTGVLTRHDEAAPSQCGF